MSVDPEESNVVGGRVSWTGFAAGPLVALLLWLTLPREAAGGLTDAGCATAAIGVWMALWWMTEAIPLAATALLPIVAFPLAGVQPLATTLRPYASDIVFLFMGGFMIGLAMQRWSLHLRIALAIVRRVGTAPARLVAGFMLATAVLSLWISNTAATVVLMPVGLSVHELLVRRSGGGDAGTTTALRNLGAALALGIAYGASIGGLGTLIGSPPNLVLANFARAELGTEITMLQWMRIGVPLVLLLLPLCWLWLVRVQFPVRLELSDTVRREIADELGALPPMSGGERIVLVVFTATALAWVFRPQLVAWTGIEAISDALIAMAGSLLLFVFPVDVRTRTFALDWETAERLPWGILLLFGGGLTLAAAISANGVDSWIAGAFTGLEGLPTFWLMVVVTTVVIFLTELTSNTAVANTFIPILAAVAVGMGAAPMPVLFGAALAATCAFMLPVATPPNAIAFASGQVTIAQMMRAGFVLNLLAIAAISLSIELFGPWLLPVF